MRNTPLGDCRKDCLPACDDGGGYVEAGERPGCVHLLHLLQTSSQSHVLVYHCLQYSHRAGREED